ELSGRRGIRFSHRHESFRDGRPDHVVDFRAQVVKPQTIIRILRDKYSVNGLRQSYWNASALAAEMARLFRPNNRIFRRHALRDQARFLFNTVRPLEGETLARARAAVAWLLGAQQATTDDGASLGYC